MIYNVIVVNIAKSYSNQQLHTEVGEIIKTHSVNKTDIRNAARRMVTWENVKRIIDLGCGYGWFEDTLEGEFELIVGVDCLVENRPPFVQRSKRTAKEVVFELRTLPGAIDFPAEYFDLAICAYSLYFFPNILPEVKRILRDDGAFVVITHSESMLEEGKKFFDFKNLRTVIEGFSAENGEGTLKKYFRQVRSVEYQNALIFRKGDEKNLTRYIDFKSEFIRKDIDPNLVRNKMLEELKIHGKLSLNKNDKIFLARK